MLIGFMDMLTRFRVSILLACLCLSTVGLEAEEPIVVIETSLGDVHVQLSPKDAPKTVENFLKHVRSGAYKDLIFHRVIAGFVIQSGGYNADLAEVESEISIYNEAANGLSNVRGSIAMARGDEIDSAAQQFFINTEDNTRLDYTELSCTREDETRHLELQERGLNKPVTCASYGYAVFGHVIKGMDIVEEIEIVETEDREDFYDIPISPIRLIDISLRKLPISDKKIQKEVEGK